MSLLKTIQNVQMFLQKFVTFPYYISQQNPETLKVIDEPFNKSKSAKLVWYTTKTFIRFLLLLPLWRLKVLFSLWKKEKDLEQLGMNLTLSCIMICGLSSYRMLEQHKKAFCYAVTEAFKLSASVQSQVAQRLHFNYSKEEILVYYLSSCVVTAYPLAVSALPLIRDYEPLEMFLLKILTGSNQIPALSIKLLAFIIYLPLSTFGALVFLTVFLGLVAVAETTMMVSEQLKSNSARMKTARFRKDVQNRFDCCLRTFRKLQVLLLIVREVSREYLQTLVCVGVVECACALYFTMLSYSKLPFPIYLACLAITLFVFTITFLLVTLASVPHENCLQFIRNCKHVTLLNMGEKSALGSCPSVGFSIGIVKIVKSGVALSISDAILNGTATFALSF